MPSGRQPNHTFNDSSATPSDLTATNTTDYETHAMEALTLQMKDFVDLTKDEKTRIATWFYQRYKGC